MLRIDVNDNQTQELRRAARQAMGRVSERIHFVLMYAQGRSVDEIGRAMNYDPKTVQHWLQTYADGGGAALDDAPRCGRPKREAHLTDVVETQASQPPTVCGYLQSVWTVGLLGLHLAERFGITVSTSSIRRALEAVHFTWHRPKLTPARRPDPQRLEKEARLQTVLADPDATLIAEDECDMCLLAVVRAMWHRVKTQVRLPTPGQNAKLGVFGALNLRTGQWHYQTSPHKRSADFIRFLSLLLTLYVTGTIYVIVDNASIHHSQMVVTWLLAHPRVQLVYLPTYSGHQLNPVEKVWWQLKRCVAANRNFKSLQELEAVVPRCLRAFSPEALLRLTNCDVTRAAQLPLADADGKNF
jgi:transposase